MANNQIERLLQFVNLQIAAEAFLVEGADGGVIPPDNVIRARLVRGNTHASVFTVVQADAFTNPNTGYDVLAQYRNDPLQTGGAGFSGTLFKNRQTGELTLSFRSTEFRDDVVRDSKSTNELELKDLGWGFGQIAEMETWYAQLRTDPNLLGGKYFNVTGYSLSGHLATAFNILRREAFEATGDPDANPILNTYTFNGAGTGSIKNGRRLTDLIVDFNRIKTNYTDSAEWKALTQEERTSLQTQAQGRVNAINAERDRVAGLPGLKNSQFGDMTAPAGDQATLGYQIAALLVARDTIGMSNFPLPGGTNFLPTSPVFAAQLIPYMTEIVGMETGGRATSFTSNSGIHHGVRLEVPIEAQPLYRGNWLTAFLSRLNLLVANPDQNDFADTHSLVLVVDSLSLMAAMEKLSPDLTIESAKLIFDAMSNAAASTSSGTQGKAEGDTLERALEAMRKILLPSGSSAFNEDQLRELLDGNTWHLQKFRTPFQEQVKKLQDEIQRLAGAQGKTYALDELVSKHETVTRDLATDSAPSGVAYRYALKELNPFAITGNTANADFYNRYNSSGELDLYNASTRTGALTTDYLTDRARLLAREIYYNQRNARYVLGAFEQSEPGADGYDPEEIIWIDIASQLKIQRNYTVTGVAQYMVFGGDTPDVVSGDANVATADRLYGGAGADILQGKRGDDYLEGGQGFDVYQFATLDGADTLLDVDGKGLLVRNGKGIALGVKENDYWISDGVKYTKMGADLEFTFSDVTTDKITLKDFDFAAAQASGYLGIRLIDVPGIPADPATTYLGDQNPQLPNDEIYGSADDVVERFQGKTGDDTIYGDDRASSTSSAGGRDLIYGGEGRDIAYGGGGDDWIEGGTEGDILLGNSGNDMLWAESSDNGSGGIITLTEAIAFGGTASLGSGQGDLLSGDAGNDILIGSNRNDLLVGGADSNVVVGGGGNDVIYAAKYRDTAELSWSVTTSRTEQPNHEVVFDVSRFGVTLADASGEGTNTVFGGAGDDWIFGGVGNDYLDGSAGDDVLFGGDGNDVLVGGASQVRNSLIGGSGKDTYILTAGSNNEIFDTDSDSIIIGNNYTKNNLVIRSGSLVLDFGAEGTIHFQSFDHGNPDATAAFQMMTFDDGSTLTWDDFLALGFDFDGTEASDDGHDTGHPMLIGTAFTDRIRGHGGNDILIGLEGDDTLDGGAGSDRLFGDSGNDILMGGDDMDALIGDAGDDSLYGGAAIDYLWGGSGNDYLEGGGGQDQLLGELGDDTYVFDEQDTVVDFLGATTIAFTGDERPEDIELRYQIVNSLPVYTVRRTVEAGGDPFAVGMGITLSSADQLTGMTFADGTVLTGEDMLHEMLINGTPVNGTAGDDEILGYAGAENIAGGDGNDFLSGYRGNDLLSGDAGSDFLDGGRGNDDLYGGTGDDVLYGGTGNDQISGGEGSDFYLYARGDGQDVITDSGDIAATDVLILDGLLASDVAVSHEANGDLKVTLNDASGSITVTHYYNTPENRIERIQFGDGSVVESAVLDSLTVAPIEGGAGADTLTGTPYADMLLGYEGADTLDGHGGDDVLNGGAGIDTYKLSLVAGNAVLIEDGTENSIIRIPDGLKFSQLQVQRSGDDLVLGVQGSQGAVTVSGYYAGQTDWTVTTSAGLSKSLADVVTFLEQSAQPSQTVDGLRQAYLDGAALQFQISLQNAGLSGSVIVDEQPFSDAATIFRNAPYGFEGSGGVYNLYIAHIIAGGSANILDFRQSNNVITDAGAGNDLIDNQGWGYDDDPLNVSIGSFLYGNAGDDKILGTWEADALIGGAGNDYISGSDGDDTYYIFGTDSGTDVIDEAISSINLSGNYFGFAGGRDSTDTLQFIGVNYEDVTFSKGQFNAATVGGTGTFTTLDISWGTDHHTRVILPSPTDPYLAQYPGESYGIETIRFADGVVLTLSDQLALAPALPAIIFGGDGADNIGGTSGSDTIYAGSGDDSINGNGGIDAIYGEAGNDSIVVVGGSPGFLYGGSGNDALSGGFGPDILDGGPGNDTLNGFPGNDTFWFGYGGGVDTVDGLSLPFGPPEIDILRFTPDVHPGDVITERSGLNNVDLVFKLRNSTDQITVKNWFVQPELFLDAVIFANDPAWNVDAIFGQLPVSVINGTTGNDVLSGTRGRNEIYGQDGNDVLTGGGNADVLDGGAGDDQLSGGAGNDILAGGSGNDTLAGGEGSDTYIFDLGGGQDSISEMDGVLPTDGDVLRFGAGISAADIAITLDSDLHININGTSDEVKVLNWQGDGGSHKIERIEFADGAVWDQTDIEARIPGAPVSTSGSNDVIIGTGFSETITGSLGNDWLNGGGGNDTLVGGPGDDLLVGGSGADTYVFDLGDGVDTVYDPSTPGERNTVVFGEGIEPSDLTLGLGSLLVRAGSGGDAIHLQSFDPQNPYGIHDIDVFRFADDSALSYEQLLARGFDIGGTAGNDDLTGTAINDRISGLSGDDILDSGDGDDELDGGAGEDVLAGGGGNDTYHYALGGGVDLIDDEWGDFDSVVLGEGITPQGIQVVRSGGLINIRVNGTDDLLQIHQEAGTGYQVEEIRFADGTVWDAATLESKVTVTNTPPIVLAPLSDQSGYQNAFFEFAVPAGTFTDANADDTLTLGATLADGSTLPGWLGFDPQTNTFSGVPSELDIGGLDVRVTATDLFGESASDVFRLDISDASAHDETRFGTPGRDLITTGFANDLIYAEGGDDTVLSGAGRDVVFGGSGRDRLSGGAGNDRLYGGSGHDWLDGGTGDDLLAGGDGHDQITTGGGNNLVIGGTGHDAITGGTGRDVFMMNRGDGHDVLYLSDASTAGNEDTLSLGGGITATSLYMRRDGTDLILETHDDSAEAARLSLADWYGSSDCRSVTTLQIVSEGLASVFDFKTLANRFATAMPDGGSWGVADSLPDVLLASGSDVIGGAVAQGYAINGVVSGESTNAGLQTAMAFDSDTALPIATANEVNVGPGEPETRSDGLGPGNVGQSVAEVLEAYLADVPNFDFEAYARTVERVDWEGEQLSTLEIQRRWRKAARHINGLVDDPDQSVKAAAAWDAFGGVSQWDQANFGKFSGNAALIDSLRGAGGLLKPLQGLEEGFLSLRG